VLAAQRSFPNPTRLSGCARSTASWDVLGEVLRAASPAHDPTLAVLSTGPEDQYYLYDDFPGLVEAQASGKVQAIFAPNLSIADDKGIYPFIPDMIRAYLGEEPVLQNAKTWSLAVEDERRYVMDHLDELVVKSRSGWGGKDVLIAPVEYVAQTVLDFSTHVLCEIEECEFVLRDSHADYRVHALASDPQTVEVVPGAMTRVAAPGSKLVNISSGGKMKDTWVLG
jgi:uncharacterized circularly permuted ATP-grasp superfamily protein